MSMIRGEEIRAAALLAAARGAVNPGVVIQNAKRFAHYIINGTDLNEVPVVVPPADEPMPPADEPMPSRSKGPHSYGCAFLDSRGFCTCGADPDLMPLSPSHTLSLSTKCANVHCGHANNWHNAGGRCSIKSPSVGFVCGCVKFEAPARRRSDNEACPECGCAVSDHTENGCSAGGRGMHKCSCRLANGTCGKVGCTDHG